MVSQATANPTSPLRASTAAQASSNGTPSSRKRTAYWTRRAVEAVAPAESMTRTHASLSAAALVADPIVPESGLARWIDMMLR